ncbi:hypothetical protein ACHWQZ_G009189 [Mnemiopsis leidyi]
MTGRVFITPLVQLAVLLVFVLSLAKSGTYDSSDCKCSAWEYVDQCGEDCRQLRWRNCEPDGCASEDESVPCYSVEWDEWGSCDPATCTRARSEACMCLMRKVSPDICMVMNLETQTEKCETDIEEGEWSSCNDLCRRSRSSTCKCVDPRTRERVTVTDNICNLDSTRGDYTENCDTRVEHRPWSDCDRNCEQSRQSDCKCDDPRGRSFDVSKSLCSLAGDVTESRLCATEWGEWIPQQECPSKLPVGKCHVNVNRYRNCYCVNEDDQTVFAVRHGKCGLYEPFKSEVPCNIPEQCACVVVGGTPAICHQTCDEEDEGVAQGSAPTCKCTPDWYKGSCDESQMQPDKKICRVQPSQWSEWSDWGPERCDENCRQTRSRTCGCFDGRKTHVSDLSKCPGVAEETRDCETEWGDWKRKPCPAQQIGQCSVTTSEYRQCGCKLNPSLTNMGNEKCEGVSYFRKTTDCPLVPYGPCICTWLPAKRPECNGNRRSCRSTPILSSQPSCVCEPSWYTGSCKSEDKPPTLPTFDCPPTLTFEWEDWLPWGSCDQLTCKRKRFRKCTCSDEEGVHLENRCGSDSSETELCETEWGPWQGGCSSQEPECKPSVATASRSCRCSASRGLQWFDNEALEFCGNLGGSTTREEQCDAKSFEVTNWGDWSECDGSCNQRRSRDCTCFDSRAGRQQDKTQCPAGTVYDAEKQCDKNWSEWSDPHCGEVTCVMKTRPRFRTCMCENGDWLDNSECGKLFEIAIKCPFIPPEDPRCRDCKCSEWECDPECDNTFTRKCGPTPGCDIEARFTKENCCMEKPPCSCTEWGCKESCDATMVRTCDDGCDIEEKPIAQLCCEVEPPCECTEWQCKDTCDATMIRSCKDGCDIEEKEIGQLCCDADSCLCTEWGCKDSCDNSMIRVCTPGCDIMEEKPIAEPCCGEGSLAQGGTRPEGSEDDGTGDEEEQEEEDEEVEEDEEEQGDEEEQREEEECYCGKWVQVSCVQGEAGCFQEEWRVCSPQFCDEQIQNVTSTCCENDQSVIPEDCSPCGRWIDIGDCKQGQNGTHQWRSVKHCDKIACEEFRCVPDGKHCKEEKCGQWYDIGECELRGQTGVHQWRDTEECFCEPYRCHYEEPEDLKTCHCSAWEDTSGCDANCVNTVSRTCDPPGCKEEWRIQSGFCCN